MATQPSPSLLSRLAGQVPAAAAAAGGKGLAGRLPALGELAPMGLMKTGLPAAGGLIAGNIAHAAIPQNTGWERRTGGAAQGALTGAGIGGTIGLAGGPLDFISVPVGAGLGALIGGGLGLLGGTKKQSPQEKAIQDLADQVRGSGIPGTGGKANSKKWAQKYLTYKALGMDPAQAMGLTPTTGLANQAMAAALTAPYVSDMMRTSDLYGQLAQQAQSMPGPYGQALGAEMKAMGAADRQGADAEAISSILAPYLQPAMQSTAPTTAAGLPGLPGATGGADPFSAMLAQQLGAK